MTVVSRGRGIKRDVGQKRGRKGEGKARPTDPRLYRARGGGGGGCLRDRILGGRGDGDHGEGPKKQGSALSDQRVIGRRKREEEGGPADAADTKDCREGGEKGMLVPHLNFVEEGRGGKGRRDKTSIVRPCFR